MKKNGYSLTSVLRYIACVGDSLSSGEFEIATEDNKRGYYDKYEYSWGQFLARKIGSNVFNLSRGGMTAKEYINSFADCMGFWDEKYKAQAYIFALGVNDILNMHQEIGSIEDVDLKDYKNNKDTFVGDFAVIVQRYKEISPDAKFFFMTMPKSYADTKEKVKLKKEHRKAIYELASLFDNCYVLDLFKKMPKYTKKLCKKYWMNGHLNPMGYVYTANITDKLIEKIIKKNPKDFYLVGMSDLVKLGF